MKKSAVCVDSAVTWLFKLAKWSESKSKHLHKYLDCAAANNCSYRLILNFTTAMKYMCIKSGHFLIVMLCVTHTETTFCRQDGA